MSEENLPVMALRVATPYFYLETNRTQLDMNAPMILFQYCSLCAQLLILWCAYLQRQLPNTGYEFDFILYMCLNATKTYQSHWKRLQIREKRNESEIITSHGTIFELDNLELLFLYEFLLCLFFYDVYRHIMYLRAKFFCYQETRIDRALMMFRNFLVTRRAGVKYKKKKKLAIFQNTAMWNVEFVPFHNVMRVNPFELRCEMYYI